LEGKARRGTQGGVKGEIHEGMGRAEGGTKRGYREGENIGRDPWRHKEA
jgi:hypothetical protein